MGVSIEYSTSSSVCDDVRTSILNELPAIAAARQWLVSEPIRFHNLEGCEGKLVGWSKIAPQSDLIQQDSNAETDDCEFIVRQLAKWSSQHGLTWEIGLENEIVGHIENGKPCDGIEAALAGLSVFSEMDVSDLLDGLM